MLFVVQEQGSCIARPLCHSYVSIAAVSGAKEWQGSTAAEGELLFHCTVSVGLKPFHEHMLAVRANKLTAPLGRVRSDSGYCAIDCALWLGPTCENQHTPVEVEDQAASVASTRRACS